MSKLSEEIANDPLGRGYADMTDAEVTVDGHTIYTTDPCTRDKTSMTPSEVYNAIVDNEMDALSASDRAEVWNILHLGEINPHGKEAAVFIRIFGPTSQTIINLKE